MNVEDLIGTMIEGALVGRRKRSRGARRYLRGGRSSLLNAGTLLTVGGLVWGVFETMQQKGHQAGGPAPAPAPQGSPTPPRPFAQQGAPLAAPPPIPGAPAAAGETAAALPTGLDAAAAAAIEQIPEGAARIVRLTIAAARADGTLTDDEQATILEHARSAGAEALVQAEIARPTPLPRIVDGIADAQQRADLYLLAYGIVRADEAVSGAEQIFLAQLGALLGLDRLTINRLEREAAARIDQAAREEDGGAGAQG
jgi:uncharacterized membrane protein YebE (DUF533 family)